MTRFEEVHDAHQLSLAQYLPESARKEFFALRAAKKIQQANSELAQKALESDRKTWWKIKV